MRYFENHDGRIVLILPFFDKVLVGSTDIPILDPDQAQCTEDEVDYILGLVKRVYPNIPVEHRQIVFRFSGVRPLMAAQASTPGQISRDHLLHIIEPDQGLDFPVFCLVGGKWTTFRSFAVQASDLALDRLGCARTIKTQELPIGGGKGYPCSPEERRAWLNEIMTPGLPVERLEVLLERYGTYGVDVAHTLRDFPDDQPLKNHPGYSRGEIAFMATQERLVHLEDLLLRRTSLAMSGQINGALLTELAECVASALDWSEERLQLETTRRRVVNDQTWGNPVMD